MENADVANDLNKYYFLTIWIETCTATLDYIKKKKKKKFVRLTCTQGAIWDQNP